MLIVLMNVIDEIISVPIQKCWKQINHSKLAKLNTLYQSESLHHRLLPFCGVGKTVLLFDNQMLKCLSA